MKKIWKNTITNIPNTDTSESIFSFDVLSWDNNKQDVEIIFLSDLLDEKKNIEMFKKSQTKPATYSNVYSPKDELEIFTELFNSALENNKKTHFKSMKTKCWLHHES